MAQTFNVVLHVPRLTKLEMMAVLKHMGAFDGPDVSGSLHAHAHASLARLHACRPAHLHAPPAAGFLLDRMLGVQIPCQPSAFALAPIDFLFLHPAALSPAPLRSEHAAFGPPACHR